MNPELPQPRPNPMFWQGEEIASGVFVGQVDDGLRLIDMPTGVRRNQARLDHAAELGAAGRALFNRVVAELDAMHPGHAARALPVNHLPQQDKAILDDLWGEGEVAITAHGGRHWAAQESVFPGLWRVSAREDGGERSEWLEVGSIPAFVRRLAEQSTRTDLDLSGAEHAGLMNALPVLAEVRARARDHEHGTPNHVINFTLLPLTPTDSEYIVRVLGEGGLRIRSDGYGSCRIVMTGLRRVWSVQFLNTMGNVVLDTLEVGDVPASALAAREDFEDSAERLRELAAAYMVEGEGQA
jgi:hydrogenase-1 operon protein HyaF